MRLRILASSRKDLEDGYQFYEAQNDNLGDYFLTSVSADIESLRLYAGIHPIVHNNFHRSLCRVFPFAIYHLTVGDEVTVYAVVDCRRSPAWVRRRLAQTNEPETPK